MKYVPELYKLSCWELTYSPLKHGTSLKTLYRNVNDRGPNIILVKDEANYVFGAFCSSSWKADARTFYGTGESFLFSFRVLPNTTTTTSAQLTFPGHLIHSLLPLVAKEPIHPVLEHGRARAGRRR